MIVVHRESEELASPQNSEQQEIISKSWTMMKRSPLLEESLKAVIEETEEELEDGSVFESVQRLSIAKRESAQTFKNVKVEEDEVEIQEKEEFEQEVIKNNTNFGFKENPCFLFQPDINDISHKKREELLPPKDPKDSRLTLVLDLDETLVHFCEVPDDDSEESPEGKSKHLFLVRPYVSTFLASCSEYFEIVVFTASVQNYADYILDILDPEGELISHRLYRRHCDLRENIYIKDLSKLARDLSRTLIVDNNADNFQLQPDNGILIKSWYGEEGDQALKNLGPLLEEIAVDGDEDVRVSMKKIGERYNDEEED